MLNIKKHRSARLALATLFRGRMSKGLPIDGGHPTILGLVEMHHPVRQKFVGLAIVCGIVGIQRQGHPLVKLERLSFQVPTRAGAGQAQAVFIIEVVEIGVNSWVRHDVNPFLLSDWGS
jgi:hypothetical protein